jgi:uncharacterized membrane protein YfcA
MRRKTKINKKSKRRTRKSRKLRGGTVMPFSEIGGFFSGISHSIGSMLNTFTVLPSGYIPPNYSNPDVSKQFLLPSSNTVQNMIKSSAIN